MTNQTLTEPTDDDVTEVCRDTLDAALRHYAWLSEANTTGRPGRTPEAWDAVADRIEAGIEREGLTGDARTFAASRARDARLNARTLRVQAPATIPAPALVLALVLAACGVVEPDALGTSVVVHVEEVQTIAPPPAPPRLALEIGGSVRAAVEVAFYAAPRVRVLAIEEDGTARDVTEQAALASSDPLAVRVAGPGRLEAPPARGSATITATLAGHEPAAPLAVTVAPRHCTPVVDAIGPERVRIANPCTIPYVVEGWRVAHRGPAADGPEATIATLAGELAPGAVRLIAAGPGDAPSGAVGLRAVFAHGTSLVDAVGYGGLGIAAGHPFIEGAPAPRMTQAGMSRRDAWDTDDNAADIAVGVGGEL